MAENPYPRGRGWIAALFCFLTVYIHDIDITIEDAFKVSELFTKLGIEHKSTSYMTMHKYGYDVAKQMCPNLNTALLQQMNLNNAIFRTPLLLSFFSING